MASTHHESNQEPERTEEETQDRAAKRAAAAIAPDGARATCADHGDEKKNLHGLIFLRLRADQPEVNDAAFFGRLRWFTEVSTPGRQPFRAGGFNVWIVAVHARLG